MGPNGSGTVRLGDALSGVPWYRGDVGLYHHGWKGSRAGRPAEEGGRAGLFLALQHPAEVPGVSLHSLLAAAAAGGRVSALGSERTATLEERMEEEAQLAASGPPPPRRISPSAHDGKFGWGEAQTHRDGPAGRDPPRRSASWTRKSTRVSTSTPWAKWRVASNTTPPSGVSAYWPSPTSVASWCNSRRISCTFWLMARTVGTGEDEPSRSELQQTGYAGYLANADPRRSACGNGPSDGLGRPVKW